MKFLMLMIPRIYQPGTPDAERAGDDFIPEEAAMEEMGRFNEELAEAVNLLDLQGLHPIAKGARMTFDCGIPQVTDGPDIEAKEVIGGYWIFEAGSQEEALGWARRVPAAPGDVIELRPIFEF